MIEDLLSKLFRHRLVCTKSNVKVITNALTLVGRSDVPNGSTFCVVSGFGHPSGLQTIWLSDASHKYLLARGLIDEQGGITENASRSRATANHSKGSR